MKRALALLERIGAGRLRGPIVDCHPSPRTPFQLRLRRERIAGLLGAAPEDGETEGILAGLDFGLDRTPDGWNVTVPTRRVDIKREVDLIEEVARHYGFDRLPVTFPALTSAPRPMDPRITRARRLRTALTAEGFHEAVTFGFVARASAARFAPEAEIVPIANPLSESFAVLRPSALPGLVDAVAHNRRREQRDVRLFEVGARFSRTLGERRALACAWTGAAVAEHWAGGGRDVSFFDLKGVVEQVVATVGVEAEVAVAADVPWLVPGRAAEVRARGERVGLFGQLVPAVADAHGLPPNDAVYVADIDLDGLEGTGGTPPLRVQPLPRFPSITRDISVLVNDDAVSADLRQTIRAAAPPTLVRIAEFDRYAGKGIPDGQMSVSLHLTFRSPDRTLTDAEVQQAMEAILGALRARHGAAQR
jgi:phenylalanyl-tRNA synthetase beta chain